MYIGGAKCGGAKYIEEQSMIRKVWGTKYGGAKNRGAKRVSPFETSCP